MNAMSLKHPHILAQKLKFVLHYIKTLHTVQYVILILQYTVLTYLIMQMTYFLTVWGLHVKCIILYCTSIHNIVYAINLKHTVCVLLYMLYISGFKRKLSYGWKYKYAHSFHFSFKVLNSVCIKRCWKFVTSPLPPHRP
jgi:hypothetical protein